MSLSPLRPVRYSDLEAIRAIFVSAFDDEFNRRGVDIGAQVGRWRKFYPLLRFLGTFPNPYRYMLNIDLLEQDGEVVGFIQTSPGNGEGSRWHIDFVAVAANHKGKGLGSKLVEAACSQYGARGAKCFTLEVDQANAPALGLYGKLGFRPYAKVTYMQADAPPPPTEGPAPEGWRRYRPSDADGLFALHEAMTPPAVRLVDTKRPRDFAMGLLERSMSTLRRRMGQVADSRYVVERGGQVVAYVRVMAQMRRLPHTVQVMVHPGYTELHAEVLAQASRVLARYPSNPVLSWAPDHQPARREALEAWGLKALTVDHCLVRDTHAHITMPAAPSNASAIPEDSRLKPAFVPEPLG